MTFADQLRKMNACPHAVEWVGDKTLQQAWTTCQRGNWMAWLTAELLLDSRRAAADMAERVWHLIEPESQLACAWAIDCARRDTGEEERAAAGDAAWGAAWDATGAAAWGAAWGAAWDAAGAAAENAERYAQADIMRDHFTWQQIAAALVKLEKING